MRDCLDGVGLWPCLCRTALITLMTQEELASNGQHHFMGKGESTLSINLYAPIALPSADAMKSVPLAAGVQFLPMGFPCYVAQELLAKNKPFLP